MNPLMMLAGRRIDAEAEADAAEWIDRQPLLRPAAAFLAHHRILHAIAATALGVAFAPIAVVAAAASTVGNLIDRAHEAAGEGTAPCQPCVTAEADEFAADGELTYTDVCNVWDLADGGLL